MVDFFSIHPLGDLGQLSDDGGSEVTLTVRHGFACTQLFAKKGKEKDVATKLKLSVEPGMATTNKTLTALPLSPGQWMAISQKADGKFTEGLGKKLKGVGHASEQSSSRICIRVSGPMARELMSRGCRLDLHESVASVGFCAQTPMAQVGVLLHQVDDAPSYDLYVYSGFARSFWQWLTHTAAQFGYSVQVEEC